MVGMRFLSCLRELRKIKSMLSHQGAVSQENHWGAVEDQTVTMAGASGW